MISLRPSRRNRVASRITPSAPRLIEKFTGSSMTPNVLDNTKNKQNPLT